MGALARASQQSNHYLFGHKAWPFTDSARRSRLDVEIMPDRNRKMPGSWVGCRRLNAVSPRDDEGCEVGYVE